MVKHRGGFTLVEVMITMAVSGLMLVIVVVLFSGQQRKTQFNQAMRSIESQVRDVINDTSTGYFPASTLTCTVSGTSISVSQEATAKEQGTNTDCVFLGKALHFTANHMDIYPVVGNSSLQNTTFQSAYPTLVMPTKESKTYLANMSLYQIWWSNTVPPSKLTTGAMLVVASTPNGAGFSTSGSLNSGVQKINTYTSGTVASSDVGIDSTEADMQVALSKALTWPSSGVTLCFEDAPSGQAGRLFGGLHISGGNDGVAARITTDTDSVVCS